MNLQVSTTIKIFYEFCMRIWTTIQLDAVRGKNNYAQWKF